MAALFVNRAQAVKYALFENCHRPEAIVELSRTIVLDLSGTLPLAALIGRSGSWLPIRLEAFQLDPADH